MKRFLPTLFVFIAIAGPLALGCVTSTARSDELSSEEQTLAVPSTESEAAAPEDFTCRPPVNFRSCQAGCCLLINNMTTPPTWSCYDCR